MRGLFVLNVDLLDEVPFCIADGHSLRLISSTFLLNEECLWQ